MGITIQCYLAQETIPCILPQPTTCKFDISKLIQSNGNIFGRSEIC